MCLLQEHFDNNEFVAGSLAELKIIETRISRENIKKKDAENLLNAHHARRKKYLEANESKANPAMYYTAGGLPIDSVLVIRTEAIRDFEEFLRQAETPQKDSESISESERNTVLKLIFGMAAAKYGFNHNSTRNAATGDKAGSISADLESLSLNIDSGTVRKYLQEATDQYSDIIIYPDDS